MTTAARAAEADAAALSFQAALAKTGTQTAIKVLVLWQSLASNAQARERTAWLAQVVNLVMARRSATHDLAVAYYRLARALRLDETVPKPGAAGAAEATFDELRREFRLLVEATGAPAPGKQAPGLDKAVVRIDQKLTQLLELTDAIERQAQREAAVTLAATGPDRLTKKLDELDTTQPADTVDKARQDARDVTGAEVAATADRIVRDGGRNAVFEAIAKDPKAIGWARVSDGNPCHFCAMLISRGAVYKSEKSAKFAIYGDGDKYHNNCGCTVVPIFNKGDDNGEAFAENRHYAQVWKDFQKYDGDLGNGDIYSQWRRYLALTKRTARSGDTKTAQEASA
ncbi:hypothetical protein [Cellulomonas sp. SG140]|uniref:VG15 protein n=1 Tax=Cellulomonas sp. SG140 TaxID=2976536 RepID=UPI0021E75654|nr:hypothetical protein [Cellulomonas sp. SG140]